MKKLQNRVNKPLIYASFERPRVTALLGARRVGKTTLLTSYMEEYSDRKWIKNAISFICQHGWYSLINLRKEIESVCLK